MSIANGIIEPRREDVGGANDDPVARSSKNPVRHASARLVHIRPTGHQARTFDVLIRTFVILAVYCMLHLI